MFFQNDSARSVIPDWSCEKDEHDQTPDDSGGTGQPGQERIHVTKTVVTEAAWQRV